MSFNEKSCVFPPVSDFEIHETEISFFTPVVKIYENLETMLQKG